MTGKGKSEQGKERGGRDVEKDVFDVVENLIYVIEKKCLTLESTKGVKSNLSRN